MIPKLFKALIILPLIILIVNNVQAQKRVCGTMDAIQARMQSDPAYKADYEKKLKDLNAYLAAHPTIESFANGDTVVIPVVVHVVLPNPNIITDDNVDYFINRLNADYSGFNPDSANGSSFYGVRGHSLLRFALARRDINGNATTGVERKVGTGAIGTTDPQPIKSAATGLAPWDITKYYNLWVGVGSGGLLGIAPEIGPGTQSGTAVDGICCDYTVFANNPCFSLSAFNMARTAVHEIGHNMGLFHTFDNGCTGVDFSQLTSAGMALPANLLTPSDDTPPISANTSGCPAQGTANGCTPSVPKMFQNYMDYTDDACYSMFTKGQVARMHYVVENFRPGYLTTKGHLPPNGTPQNEAAANSIVSPGGSEVIGCNAVSYPIPTCGTGTFIPKLRVTNFGVQNLNTITVSLDLNGSVISQTFTTNLLGGRSAVFSLPSQTLTNGTNILKYYTSNPNGILDSINTNDTLTLTVNFSNLPPTPALLPLVEGFEDGGFNPTASGWKVVNNNSGTTTWTRSVTAAKTGAACATMKMFGYTSTGDFDYLKSPSINFNNTSDTAYISFNYAYRLKGTTNASRRDTLSVEVATDCGATNWTSIWKKGGTALATNATVIATNWTAAAADWATSPVKISLQAYKNTPIYIALKTRNGNGQNIYVDDINIYTVPNPLPLTMLSFKAIQNAKNITCKWETANEEHIKDFTVERSINGSSFESVGTVVAAGNTTATSYYQFTDNKAFTLNSPVLYYRLKSNDINGKFSYSNIIVVKIGEKQIIQVYPNPATDKITINLNNTSISATNNTVQIVDYLGRVLLQQKALTNAGNTSLEFNINSLPKGNYVVVVKNEIESKTIKFVKE